MSMLPRENSLHTILYEVSLLLNPMRYKVTPY
jgi:hypothetical protein